MSRVVISQPARPYRRANTTQKPFKYVVESEGVTHASRSLVFAVALYGLLWAKQVASVARPDIAIRTTAQQWRRLSR